MICSLTSPFLFFEGKEAEYQEISAIIYENKNSNWSNMRYGMEAAAYDFGIQLRYVSVLSGEELEENVVKEVVGGTDGLILTSTESPVLEDVFRKNEDLPILLLEGESSEDYASISLNHREIGINMAHLCEEYETILLLDTGGTNSAVKDRVSAAYQELFHMGKTPYLVNISLNNLERDLEGIVRMSGAQVLLSFDSVTSEMLTSVEFQEELVIYAVGSTNKLISALGKEFFEALVVWNEYAMGYYAVESVVSTTFEQRMKDEMAIQVVKKDDIYEKEMQKLLFPLVY